MTSAFRSMRGSIPAIRNAFNKNMGAATVDMGLYASFNYIQAANFAFRRNHPKDLRKELFKAKEFYAIGDAVILMHRSTTLKRRNFDESVDIACVLNLDPKKPNQSLRGSTVLPNGTGKTPTVAVFCRGNDIATAEKAGAQIIGDDELIKQIQSGSIKFDKCIATPEMMPMVSKVARFLGPRGLMPNPKLGTVTREIDVAIKSALGGQVGYRADKFGMVHAGVGRVSFSYEEIMENIRSFMIAITNDKPEGAKGKYFKSFTLNTTMGPGIKIDPKTIDPGNSRFMHTTLKPDEILQEYQETQYMLDAITKPEDRTKTED